MCYIFLFFTNNTVVALLSFSEVFTCHIKTIYTCIGSLNKYLYFAIPFFFIYVLIKLLISMDNKECPDLGLATPVMPGDIIYEVCHPILTSLLFVCFMQ